VLVAHTCNPGYSGGRDQEDCGWKPAWENSSQDSILKIPSQKRTGGMAQGGGPEFLFCNTTKTNKKETD
jgi:hypothetical protein